MSAHALDLDIGTGSGMRFSVGRSSPDRRAGHVTLAVTEQGLDHAETWANLTPAEARSLAAALTAQADAVDAGRPPASPAIDVAFAGGESYAVTVRGHAFLVDQPTDAGGADLAATPTELFVASLATCVMFYAGRYLTRHGLTRDGLHITASHTMAEDRPARVATIALRLTLPDNVPETRTDALLAVASHCTVHNSLTRPPNVEISIHQLHETAD